MTGPVGKDPGERSARPLQPVALGLLVVALTAPFGGYDAFADPVGWALVLAGVGQLPPAVAQKRALLVVGALALAASAYLWLPAAAEDLLGADASLVWAANLPQVAFTGLLCHVLAGRAAAAGDAGPARWLRLAVVLTGAVAAAPVLVFGAGLDQWEAPSYVLGAVTLLLVIVLILTWAGRAWAGTVDRSGETAADGRPGP
ncbi:hypothetical protein [Nocardioides sp. SYSU DS0663]|uniref:hypothetical protein n=1 Tax=Nocardioides sp. SYSU DS0663 TaxID=3416445 RepID=UPI003F4B68B2